MLTTLLQFMIVSFVQDKALGIILEVSPNYILKNNLMFLTCHTNESVENGVSTIYRNNTKLASYNDSTCFPESIPCNATYSQITWQYTPSITPSSGESYHCDFTDEKNFTTRSIAVFVRNAEIPKSAELNPDATAFNVTKGQTFNVCNCSAECWPVCLFYWTGPNNYNRSGQILSLSNIQTNSDGQYRCQATNVLGSIYSNNIIVVVQYGPVNITISPQKDTYNLDEGSELGTVTCSATCEPSCSYVWTYPDKSQTVGSTISINSIMISHHGFFTCTASNGIESPKAKTFSITVNYGPRYIKLSPTDLSYTMNEGEALNVVLCSASCRPGCSYQWLYPDGSAKSGQTMSISSVQRSHDGVFKCRAYNRISNSTTSFQMTVNYKPENITTSTSNNSVVIIEYNTVNIECSANCKPICSYSWTGPGVTSANSRLSISSITRTLAGSYRCRASNYLGAIDSSYVIIIVHTRPSKVHKLSTQCIGPTGAVIAWNPDHSVVPEEMYKINFKPSQSITFTTVPYLNSQNNSEINILHLNNLNPATEYVYTITSENYLASVTSNQITCRTAARSDQESSVDGSLIAGIVLIALALVIVIIVITAFIIQRYRRKKKDQGDENTKTFQFPLFSCISRCRKHKDSHPYENTRPGQMAADIENTPGNLETDHQKREDQNNYEVLERQPTDKYRYDKIQLKKIKKTGKALQNDDTDTSHYVNVGVKKKQKRQKKNGVILAP